MITTLMSGRWIERAGQGQGVLGGHVRSKGHDLDTAAAEFAHRVARVEEHSFAPVAQRTGELAVERLADTGLELEVRRGEYQPAHARACLRMM